MNKVLSILLLLYLLALNTSIAGMEIFGWLVTITAVSYQLFKRRDFSIFKRNRALNLSLLAMALAVAGGLIFNPLLRPFMFQFGFMRWVLVMWGMVFALQEVWSEKFEQGMVKLWTTLVIVTGPYALIQCLFGIDLIRVGALEVVSTGIFRAPGWFSNILTFAYSYGMSLIAVFLPAVRQRKNIAWLLLICGVMGLIGPVARGAWVAASAVLLLYLVLNWRIMVLPAAVGIVALLKVLNWYNSGFGNKIPTATAIATSALSPTTVDHSSGIRLDLWRAYWEMFTEHPWFGTGLGQSDLFLPDIYAKLGIHQEFTSHAHNNLLQFLGGAGIFGFLAYCAANAIILWKAWNLRKHSVWGWSILLANLYIQIGGLTEANFTDGEVTHFIGFTWALLLVIEARTKESTLRPVR